MTEALLAADSAARIVALTALDRTLLVEAGAGSGKTSVLAGRVTSLLAAGRPPGEIAAITFTELAASELRERVATFVAEVAAGHVRADLRGGFPDGPTAAQRDALIAARDGLDELLCTTIHGFCQRLLTPYPVEAGMDPGAAIMDSDAADELFAEQLEIWLRERLSGERRPDDLLVALYIQDTSKADSLIRNLAAILRHHRGASVPMVAPLDDALHELRQAVAAFRSFLTGVLPCVEPETDEIVRALEQLLEETAVSGHEADILPRLLDLPVPQICATKSGFAGYRRLTKWRQVLKASRSTVSADILNGAAVDHYAACVAAHAAAQSYAAGRILHLLAADLQQVLDRFAAAKRGAALIDFDDLMVKTRDLLRSSPPVRAALSRRFTAVLVDEFQDTDRLQCEILWRLCAEVPDDAEEWMHWPLRPGSLFLVGDPKQAIYRFRGADVASYLAARDRLTTTDLTARVDITQNFRSFDAILDWVNQRFETSLSAAGQPGFTRLFTTASAPDGHTAVATLPIEVAARARADERRDAEADAVAAFCARIIGALPVRGRDGMRPCRPDDIALLAPSSTELWRYERALELQDIAVSTQAGKGFYRRQEVQDLIALTRILADARDTLALGALLRGPLVGMTEEELLDAVVSLPGTEHGPGRLSLWTPLEHLPHNLLRETLEILQALAKQVHATTPFVLLSQAVEELQVRALLRRRQDRTAERALANVDQFLESARSYDLRGLHAFAAAMKAQWEDAQRTIEGRPDTEQQSVSLVTMHSSKGLEWPVVIPINMSGDVQNRVKAAVDAGGQLHFPIFGMRGPGGDAALQAERDELDRERQRLWYVAATRARDLLLVPAFSTGIPQGSWMTHVGLKLDDLSPFDLARLPDARLGRDEEPPNTQDRARFETEAALIASRTSKIERITPHLAEAGEDTSTPVVPLSAFSDDRSDVPTPPRGSLARGLVLHKLLEEILTGETMDDTAALTLRAATLAAQLDGVPGAAAFDPAEAAEAVRRGLTLPAIENVRHALVPEFWIADSAMTDSIERITLGVADAVELDADGRVRTVVDWKSDVAPTAATIAHYRAQVRAYLAASGASRGLIVYLSSGAVDEVV